MAGKKKMTKKLKIPLRFDEAVGDFLKVKPAKKKASKVRRLPPDIDRQANP